MLNGPPKALPNYSEIWYILCHTDLKLSQLEATASAAVGVWEVVVPVTLQLDEVAAAVLGAFLNSNLLRNPSSFSFIVCDPYGDEYPIDFSLDMDALAKEHGVWLVKRLPRGF